MKTKLLNIDANPKTIKGQKHGYMTAVMYLSPYKLSGRNVCPMAELAQCHGPCLNVQGRAAIAKGNAKRPDGLPDNAIQAARMRRTRLFHDDRAAFMAQLVREIRAFIRKAERAGLTPVLRLNGTSDIDWRKIPADAVGNNIFEVFPALQFYDYSKVPNRRNLPANYHISLSYSGADARYAARIARAAREQGRNLVKVYRTKADKAAAMAADPLAIDGDAHDLRFLDPVGTVYLLAKGSAKHDRSGFVLDHRGGQ